MINSSHLEAQKKRVRTVFLIYKILAVLLLTATVFVPSIEISHQHTIGLSKTRQMIDEKELDNNKILKYEDLTYEEKQEILPLQLLEFTQIYQEVPDKPIATIDIIASITKSIKTKSIKNGSYSAEQQVSYIFLKTISYVSLLNDLSYWRFNDYIDFIIWMFAIGIIIIMLNYPFKIFRLLKWKMTMEPFLEFGSSVKVDEIREYHIVDNTNSRLLIVVAIAIFTALINVFSDHTIYLYYGFWLILLHEVVLFFVLWKTHNIVETYNKSLAGESP